MSDQQKVRAGFWSKVKQTAGKVPFVLDAIAMYYCMLDAKTPMWVKGTIATALLYFIVPADAVPDLLPVVGYTDDAGVIVTALTAVGSHVTERHQRQARSAMDC